jgi:dTDP-4-dehydrorhamnose reductase
MEMLQTNALLPQTIARVCEATNTPWGHVSSGSIYSGAKIIGNGTIHTESDLASPATCELFAAHSERFRGFNETDEPNFSFKSAPCTFYSGTKALAEEALRGSSNYIWRLRLPFTEQDDPANFLSQLQDRATLHDAINSLSQLDECVSACLQLWERHAPFGTYNIVNPGAVRTNDVMQMIQRVLKPARRFQLLVYQGDADNGEKVPHSDCILDVSKLGKAGIKLRPVSEAIEKALHEWRDTPKAEILKS